MQFFDSLLSLLMFLDKHFWANQLAVPQLAALFVAGSLEMARSSCQQRGFIHVRPGEGEKM